MLIDKVLKNYYRRKIAYHILSDSTGTKDIGKILLLS